MTDWTRKDWGNVGQSIEVMAQISRIYIVRLLMLP